jgi:DUF4097 and DUF4098 domain-containing protein YvlB
VRGSDDSDIRVSAKKNVRTWSDVEAERAVKPVNVTVSQNGNGYEVRPGGYDAKDARISVDLEIAVPNSSSLSVKTDKGNVTVSDMESDVTVSNNNGDVEVHTVTGDVAVDMRKGDAHVNDTKGDVKISGKGGEIEVNEASGSLTVDGDFYGPVRADRVSKGVRLVSPRTDLTLSSLAGHLEAGSGNLELVDAAAGNLSLRTRDTQVDVENPGGKVMIENRNAQTTLRFSSAPKDDVQITNSSSGISLALPNSASFEIEADCRNCEIESEFPGLNASKTESGDSHLSGKNGSGRGPKIVLRTSYGNIELRRTVAAIPAPPKPPAVPGPPKVAVPHVPAPPALPPAQEQ